MSRKRELRVLLFLIIAVLILAALAIFSKPAEGQVPPVVRVAVIPIAYAPSDWSGPNVESSIREAMGEALSIFTNASRGSTSFTVLVGKPFQTTKIPGQCFEGYAAAAMQTSGLVADKWLFLTSDGGCRYGGEAAVGGNIGYVNAGTASYVIAHELGHMLGLNHANSIICILPGNLTVCHFHEYGDPIDVMAGGSTVQALERAALQWPIQIQRHPPGYVAATYAMTDIEAGGYAVQVSRDDAIPYTIELRSTGFYVRMTYDARYNFVVTLRPGPDGINYQSVYRDVTGGVQLTAVDATHLKIERFAAEVPTPGPTAPPFATPRPPTTVTPDPDCWTLKPYIRCSPTPAATRTPTPTPSPGLTVIYVPPLPVPTDTPSPGPPPPLPSNTPAVVESPLPSASPTPTPKAPPAITPIPGKSPKHCPGFGLFGVVLIGGPFALWRKRLRRGARGPRSRH